MRLSLWGGGGRRHVLLRRPRRPGASAARLLFFMLPVVGLSGAFRFLTLRGHIIFVHEAHQGRASLK